MEFSEIGEKLGGLTADQVFNLAGFGKKILDHTGIVGLSSGLQNLVKDIFNAEDWVFDENRNTIENLMCIIAATDELMEKCWGEKKTPFGLTGVQTDNDYFGLKKLLTFKHYKDMETKEKTNKEMTYEEKKQENLKELYGFDYAERTKKALISDKTRATLYVRGMVEDLQCALFSLHTLLYGDYDDETGEKLVEALKPVESIVNEYVIDSINENISFRNFKDI